VVTVRESSHKVKAGKPYGRWTVLGQPFSRGFSGPQRVYSVVVECECGTISVVKCVELATGHSTECRKCHAGGKVKHGDSRRSGKARLYGIWRAIITRCTNGNYREYHLYGGRGISICDEWLEDYEAFRDWALAHGYADSLQIDRFPNKNGDYSPTNCRWVTSLKNNRNKRDNRLVEAFGETKCLTEWAENERCRVPYRTLIWRLNRGWTPELAIAKDSRNAQSS
jgi:hypothetical protein